MDALAGAAAPLAGTRLAILDGWRAISILAVLAGHWLPLGQKTWALNPAVAASGMALFFCLSGFLIANLLMRDDRPGPFLVRRLFRILPLAWLAIIILVIANRADYATVVANLLFYANLPPAHLMVGGEPLWSLCIEVQFYFTVAMIVALFGRRGLIILPFAAAVVTAYRLWAGVPISIYTWERVDEILSGATLALLFSRRPAAAWRSPRWLPLPLGTLLVASGHPALEPLAYARPYLAAATIGSSLLAAPHWMVALLGSRPARYVSEVSYALYVIHGMLTATWLGGETATTNEKYGRRPLLIALTFILAHLSTRYFESYFIALGRKLARAPRDMDSAGERPA